MYIDINKYQTINNIASHCDRLVEKLIIPIVFVTYSPYYIRDFVSSYSMEAYSIDVGMVRTVVERLTKGISFHAVEGKTIAMVILRKNAFIAKHENMQLSQCCNNERDGLSNHQPHDCLLNGLFKHRSKKPQSSASLVFVGGIQRWRVNSPH